MKVSDTEHKKKSDGSEGSSAVGVPIFPTVAASLG
jgi:hypothetical protein